VDVADLSRGVLAHAGYFEEGNKGVLRHPRLAVYINDGRQHLRHEHEHRESERVDEGAGARRAACGEPFVEAGGECGDETRERQGGHADGESARVDEERHVGHEGAVVGAEMDEKLEVVVGELLLLAVIGVDLLVGGGVRLHLAELDVPLLPPLVALFEERGIFGGERHLPIEVVRHRLADLVEVDLGPGLGGIRQGR
jgi:hypothetical protein